MAVTLDDARRLFDRRRAAWLAEDLDAYVACFADDVVLDVPGRTVQGHGEYVPMSRVARSSGRSRCRSSSIIWPLGRVTVKATS